MAYGRNALFIIRVNNPKNSSRKGDTPISQNRISDQKNASQRRATKRKLLLELLE